MIIGCNLAAARGMTVLTRLFAALLAALAGVMVLPPPAVTAGTDGGSILVIMDVSGSMERRDDSGTTLIAGARRSVQNLVAKAPAQTRVGLRLYGHTYGGTDERRGCRDSELVVPIGPLSSTGDRIDRAIARTRPTGFTPIGHSLRQAADDFPPEGQRTIVLVSDGEDTCGDPEPCQAARQLAGQGIDVRVDTVGLFLQDNPAARRQLQCIAKTTGGRYYPADDATQLIARLNVASQRAIQRYETSGGEIDGGAAAPRAAAVEPDAPYVDDVRPGEARWYSFEAERGQVARLTLTEDGSTEYGCCFKVRLLDPGVDQLTYDSGSNRDGTARTVRLETDDQGLRDTGSHFIEVTLEQDAANRAVTYEFTVEVAGEGFARPTSSPAPTESPSTSESPTEDPSATPEETESADPEPASADSDDDNGGLLWLVVALLLLLVLLVGGFLSYLLKRDGRTTAAPRGGSP